MVGKNKRGISTVVASIIMIALVIVIAVVVWTVINSSVTEQVSNTGSCFGVFGKVSLDERYTCYNSSSNEIRMAVNIQDVDVDSVLVRVSSISGTKAYTITKEAQNITGLRFYNDTNFADANLTWAPGQNTGITYIASGFDTLPDSIDIAPIISGSQCEVSSKIEEIDNCNSLA